MKLKLLFLPFILAVAALAIAGCSGDDDDDSGDDGGSEATASAPADNGDDGDSGDDDSGDDDDSSDGGGGFGSGTGTLTIGEESWDVTGIGCVFTAEESGQDSIPFNLSGFTESSTGARAQVSADVYDPDGLKRMEGEGVSHHISIDDIDDFENPSVSWSTIGSFGGGTETKLTIDGKHISGVGTFDDGTTDEFESVDGTLEVDCP